MEVTLLLLRFNCPAPDCAHMAVDWNTLEKHTLSNHASVICRVCRSQLSRFAHEQVLYPPHLLALHDPSRLRPGQKPPRPRGDKELEMVKTWDAPHPMCEASQTSTSSLRSTFTYHCLVLSSSIFRTRRALYAYEGKTRRMLCV